MRLLDPADGGVARAAALLREGEVIAFPTDTVYGLAARASDEAALLRIYSIKGRPEDRPLVLMVRTVDALEQWAHVDARARAYIERWWPGPLTLVLPARHRLGFPLATGSPPTIAARIPDHAVARSLLEAAGEGLATTSANRSGLPPALTPDQAALDGVAAVLDGGAAPGGQASTLLDLTQPRPRVLREGPVPAAALVPT